jgi:flagellar motility protein MotE (MotC chaperone)
MRRNKQYAGVYPIGILLLLLLLKLALTVVFAWTRQDAFLIYFQSQAVAAETVGHGKTNKDSIESSLKERVRESQTEAISKAVVEKKRFELEMERRDIQREREQLVVLQKEIKKTLLELSKLQDNIKEIVAKKSAAHERKIKHLIKVYTSMAPKKAAGLIEKLDIDIIVEVFSNMKGDSVGKILSYVKPEKAAVISERLIKK